jgi:hypothetical protein
MLGMMLLQVQAMAEKDALCSRWNVSSFLLGSLRVNVAWG